MTVITGLGVVAPTGVGVADYWATTLAGKSGIDRIRRFDPSPYSTQLAGEVDDFESGDHVPAKLLAQTDRMTHFAFAGADMALTDAGADPADFPEYDRAVVTANSAGGVEYGQRELQKMWSGGPMRVSAYMSVAWFYAATTGQLSIHHGLRGPCGLIATEQAGALDAIGHARRQLRRGARLAVTGGTDAPLSPACMVAQLATGMLSSGADPTAAYLPFDSRAAGYVPGEGGAIMIMERREDAERRGAERIYGEVAGYAATFDPAPESGRGPTLARAIRSALDDARIAPGDVDAVFADGYGVPDLDRQEARALTEVFGPRGVPVTVPKTATGRMYSGGAALDVAAALLAMRDGVLPPTPHVNELAADCPLDLVRTEPRELTVRHALVCARGVGGFNSALVLRTAA
ncbi:ketosynthase chain-length factor [Streptomyces luteolifulvus]|uniref:Ketosynthase chain-length factor n=1 Tax=Streptomyces luteolifulvus TaxID=2615112 RepID=A0A6H9UV09_9ACTN|nr:ketosynthase chain-length factor [Streptomyces luteolifulvus]KAB1142370.1 ketosynthase chain-length factor [Streptomyces luteolifulvus]